MVLTTEELANELGLKPQTLRSWRAKGLGPAWFAVSDGGPVRYRRSDVEAWMEERLAVNQQQVSVDRRNDHSVITSPCDE